MSKTILLLPLWAFVACSKAKCTFTFTLYYIIILYFNLYHIYILSVLLCCQRVTQEMEASAT